MATIRIDGTDLTIDVQGLDRLWTFKSRLTIPMAHVRGATADPSIAREYKGWRGPGTLLPGFLVAGTFHHEGKKVFWDVHNRDKAVVIELEDDSYQRLVIEVDDPRATVELIERAVANR
jgi:hypothetical protein